MLKSLTIVNFALIEKIHLEFSNGLNILTGETGAGKSILIDALSAVTGGRVSQDSIRTGEEYFRVDACFDIGGVEEIIDFLEEQGITREDDGSLLVSRKFTRHGKNTIIINGCQVTLGTLREIGEKLIDMYGQHENQALLKPAAYIDLLDNFAADCKKLREEYQVVYKKWREISSELESAKKNSRDILQRQDMLSWQTREIEAASLSVDEEGKIEREAKALANAEKIFSAVNNSYILLSQGQRGSKGIIDGLAEIRRNLETAARYDDKIAPLMAIIEECFYQIEEVSAELRSYLEEIEFNPNKLSVLEERLDQIYKLKRKYGTEITDILKYYDEAMLELTKIENHDQYIQELEKKHAASHAELDKISEELDKARRIAAENLAGEISSGLRELAMPKALFQIEVKFTEDFLPAGRNEVFFLFSANPGVTVKMLNKIVSGGELSRLALAIKAACAMRGQHETMIFDEIDAGIGGQTAQTVAEKIAVLAASSAQILCITHLPQIACMADCHIHVSKHVQNERTTTLVEILTGERKITEIAKMLSGEVTEESYLNASQMLDSAQNKKNNLEKQK